MDLSAQCDVVILAGGLGTRLKDVLGEMPKCMAPVDGRPFLHYIFRYLENQNARRVVLSLGYRNEVVTDWLDREPPAFKVDHVVESQQLGTGGGIRLALEKCETEDVLVLNGDTMFDLNLAKMMGFHHRNAGVVTVALKPQQDTGRYGIVGLNSEGLITTFKEKAESGAGLINGGVYAIQKAAFLERTSRGPFSFEKEYLQRFVNETEFYGFMSDAYFIDIGVPEDYSRAQVDFQRLFPE